LAATGLKTEPGPEIGFSSSSDCSLREARAFGGAACCGAPHLPAPLFTEA